MAHYIYKTGLKIKLDRTYTVHEEIGLFANELRWSDSKVFGLPEKWAYGIIADSVGDIAQVGNFIKGGSLVSPEGLNIKLFNNNQLILRLKELGISLTGLICEVWEFVGTDSDADAFESSLQYTGICEDIKWSQMYLTFPIKSVKHKRRANLGLVISNEENGTRPDASNDVAGQIIPITFGESSPADNRFFVARRTVAKEDVLSVNGLAISEGYRYPPAMNLFPISDKVGDDPSRTYRVRLGYLTDEAFPAERAQFLAGKYAICKEGDELNNGAYRKIESVTRYTIGQTEVDLTFKDYWTGEFSYNYTGTAEKQAWLQILDIDRKYELDYWKCSGFYDSKTEEKLINGVELYGKYDDDSVIRIPSYGCDLDISNNNDNSLTIDPKLFNKNPNNLSSFLILPVENFDLYKEAIDVWRTASEQWWGNENYQKISDGLYGIVDEVLSTSFQNPEAVIDHNPNTYSSFTVQVKQNSSIGDYLKMFRFTLPELPKGFEFSGAYIGVKLWSKCGAAYENPGFRIMTRGYIGRVKNAISDKKLDERNASGAWVNNLPDFYYVPNESTANVDFYRSAPADANDWYQKISGFRTIDMQIKTVEEYEAIEECCIVFSRTPIFGSTYLDETKIYQIAIILESNAEVEKAVYL